VQRSAVLAALEESGWVQARAARRLGLTRWSLRRLLQRHGLLDEVSELRDAARRTRATEARPPGSNASEPDGA
jgi:hypothetical protein